MGLEAAWEIVKRNFFAMAALLAESGLIALD
jgi:hypothetical protein